MHWRDSLKLGMASEIGREINRAEQRGKEMENGKWKDLCPQGVWSLSLHHLIIVFKAISPFLHFPISPFLHFYISSISKDVEFFFFFLSWRFHLEMMIIIIHFDIMFKVPRPRPRPMK